VIEVNEYGRGLAEPSETEANIQERGLEPSAKKVALLLYRAFLWIYTTSSAFLNLHFCVTSLMSLNH